MQYVNKILVADKMSYTMIMASTITMLIHEEEVLSIYWKKRIVCRNTHN